MGLVHPEFVLSAQEDQRFFTLERYEEFDWVFFCPELIQGNHLHWVFLSVQIKFLCLEFLFV